MFYIKAGACCRNMMYKPAVSILLCETHQTSTVQDIKQLAGQMNKESV